MAFSLGAISAWTNEIADRSEWIMKPILAAKTLQALNVDVRTGLTGFTDKLPTLESTTPWQAGASCGFTTSGSTTVDQISLTTVPVKIQEQICLQDLETYFTNKLLSKTNDRPETFQLLDMWVGRKLEQAALQIESALWQAKTTYTNATHLKLFNGWIATSDTAATAIAATQQASISTSTVRGIMEEIAYTKIPSRIRNLNPVVVCGQDTFNIYMNKLMTDNLYHYDPSNKDLNAYTTNIFGTNVKLIGLPGLNNDNAVDTGVLPTAVKNRIFATYEDNLLVGMNAKNDINDFDVWYSKDDQVLKFMMRFHLGVAIKYNDLVVQYTNI